MQILRFFCIYYSYSLATLDKILWEAVKSGVACIACKCGQCLNFYSLFICQDENQSTVFSWFLLELMCVRQIPFLQVQPNYYYKQKIHQIIKRSQMPQHDRFEQNGIKHQERSPALSIIIPKISSQTKLQRLLFLQLLCNCWEKQQSFWILWQDNKKLHMVKWYERRRIKIISYYQTFYWILY